MPSRIVSDRLSTTSRSTAQSEGCITVSPPIITTVKLVSPPLPLPPLGGGSVVSVWLHRGAIMVKVYQRHIDNERTAGE